ncbi:unnamed protein product [Rotaria sordida]|uniref:Uncharacterized protein n=1 Tax=Rotaria sordida TaxID=392033 RepID=A0A815K546_9BILA|nr:unnamed protein product [Rotaria sordida]CAF1617929.1 unnamed protein product [Rotaria sordida]
MVNSTIHRKPHSTKRTRNKNDSQLNSDENVLTNFDRLTTSLDQFHIDQIYPLAPTLNNKSSLASPSNDESSLAPSTNDQSPLMTNQTR